MRPLFNALRERLWNEPTFFLYAAAAAAVVVADQVDLPGWVAPVAVAVFGVANRAVVTPVPKAKRVGRIQHGDDRGAGELWTVVLVLLAILLVLLILERV